MTAHDSSGPRSGPLPVIAPRGEFDLESLAPLKAQIDAAVAAHGGVVLDAGGITFADSSFLGLLLATHQHADLRIAAPSSTVVRLFSVVGADTVLCVHPTVQDALSAA
ncbi:STAS domain-containing protein [Streptomyces cyaneofuscatus]|uniref:STAS domain-containing protein n=1 Tax=Streptomyces cyaneofuscatus TaxID=66883 RepID=UPI0013DBEC78|nr:STAS domain-containing protein [Streptomyces cyaneofuscatus]NDZ63332.1 STAS domain-containing protein [Streptomyces cyaneofuscatus]